MGDIIKFPSSKDKELKANIMSLIDTLPVNELQWEEIAVPAIEKLSRLPEFNISVQLGVMDEQEAVKVKEDLTKAIKEWGVSIQKPLLFEVVRLYASLLRDK